ncbi:uncharacterized protein LOC116843776 isoform X2 [Odontomachus brunneus]|uniref:uncharacterized protein LOC116843776 isoform X2 n=1 Tax=Odontomachus brunneus TaxID=486640 RepID=UPI0013F29926|nr:uncharacterized protein LOC116843776 isoform X2 [Odontomachus brunneus]
MTTDGVFTETQCRRLDTDSTQTRGCFSGITTISFQPRLPAVGRSATLGEVEAGLCRRFQDHVHADCLRMVCVMRISDNPRVDPRQERRADLAKSYLRGSSARLIGHRDCSINYNSRCLGIIQPGLAINKRNTRAWRRNCIK